MLSDIYCDNELLQELIVDAKPSQGGLYPHELAMIFYCSIGQVQYENPSFAGVFVLQLNVKYPICLLYSLVERGFIRKSRFEENINFYGTRQMQQFLKDRGAKSSSRRVVLAEILRANFTEAEIRKAFPQDYFVPTEKGQTELNITKYTIMDAYKGWTENKGHTGLLKSSDINIRRAEITDLIISEDKGQWTYSLLIDGYKTAIGPRMIQLPKRSNLIVQKCGRAIYTARDVDTICILKHRKVLIFESIQAKHNQKVNVLATGFDVEEERPLYTEVIDKCTIDRERHPFPEYIEQKVKPFGKAIRHDGRIDYYATINDQIAYLFLSEYLSKKRNLIQITDIENFLSNDPTHNIKISVLDTDENTKNIVHYLVAQHLLLPPAISGISFSQIALYFYIKDTIKAAANATRKYYLEDDLDYHIHCEPLMEQIEAQDGGLAAFESYFWKFPIPVFFPDLYRYYDSSGSYKNDENWEYAKLHETALRTRYSEYLLEMKESGMIPTRWINELSLYFSVRSYFPDAIYQYRCDWLGLQSLDIFIPSRQVGIEYQGKQHYEAVEFFGGEQALVETQRRDARKHALCKENRVQLLTWHYSVPVQADTVYKFLVASGIWQPEEPQ